MEDIILMLYGCVYTENPKSTQYIIAKTILENITKIEDASLKNIANLCNVSQSAITRFCSDLGLDGFYELKYMITKYERHPELKFSIPNQDMRSLSLEQYFSLQQHSIMNAMKNFDFASIDRMAQMIMESKRVVIFGMNQSGGNAIILQTNLSNFEKYCEIVLSPTLQHKFFDEPQEDCFVLFISRQGAISRRLNITEESKQKNMKFGLITLNKDFNRQHLFDVIVNAKAPTDFSTDQVMTSMLVSFISLRCYQIYMDRKEAKKKELSE